MNKPMVMFALLCFGVASLSASPQENPAAIGAAEKKAAYFYLSSDEIRALRDVTPAANLVLHWTKHVEILEGASKKSGDSAGTVSLGPDYFSWQETGGQVLLVDFSLRRMFQFFPGKPGLGNSSLFEWVDARDMEAINRAYLSRFDKAIGLKQTIPLHEQYLYEAELGVSTKTLPPISIATSTQGDTILVRHKDEEIATFKFGQPTLTPEQSEMLGKALQYFLQIHPAALKVVQPFQRLPLEISTLHAFDIGSKARTTIQLQSAGTSEAQYPLPEGLKADPHDTSGLAHENLSTFLTHVTDIALSAISGSYSKKRPVFDDYIADATRAYAAGDHLESGLAWLAASLHFPDQISACDSFFSPSFCAAYHEQMKAAARDPQFALVAKGASYCTRNEAEKGTAALAGVDISGKPHGYVVSMLLSCTLSGLPTQKSKTIDGIGTRHPATAVENAIRAIEANPYIPSYYYDLGSKFAMAYDNWAAWRLFDLGLALGGGRRGDAFDRNLREREQYLISRYPEYF